MIERASWIAGLAIAALLWIKAHDAQVRNGALADARADSMRVVLATGDSLQAVLASSRAALEAAREDQASQDRRIRLQLAAADQAVDSTRAVLDSLLASLPDSAPLAVAITNERIAAAGCRLALSSCDSLGVLLTHELANRDSVIAVLEPSLERVRVMWQEAEKRSRPDFFARLRIGLPFAAAGVIVGALIVR